ncbi:MAG: hypothetical protein AAGU74_01300 [Bacillota bacterium]
MYYVEQKYFDNGKVEVRILLESEVVGAGGETARYAAAKPGDAFCEEHADYDLYVDCFSTYEEAEEFKAGALKA